jgi:hypothetical protein
MKRPVLNTLFTSLLLTQFTKIIRNKVIHYHFTTRAADPYRCQQADIVTRLFIRGNGFGLTDYWAGSHWICDGFKIQTSLEISSHLCLKNDWKNRTCQTRVKGTRWGKTNSVPKHIGLCIIHASWPFQMLNTVYYYFAVLKQLNEKWRHNKTSKWNTFISNGKR